MNGKTNAAGTQELRRPSKQRLISLRGLFSIALLVLLPPVGLLFLWNQGVFRTRGRMVLTALATVEMMALCVLLTPRPQLVRQLAEVVALGGDETDLMTEEEKLQKQSVDREAILNTIVYAVYNNARLYHAQRVCGTQSNNRELTVQQAMMEALGPCPDCNPPVWKD